METKASIWRSLPIWILLYCISHTAGCSGKEPPRPGEVTGRIKLDLPSILGYARVRVDLCRAVTTGGSLVSAGFQALSPCLETVAPLCRPDSHVVLVFLDPVVFGGASALFFESEKQGALVEALEKDVRFQRVAGSDPPEFCRAKETGLKEKVMAFAAVFGMEVPFDFSSGNARLIVDEIDEGTLVLPSYDLRRDFLRFLEETAFLEAWGEADLVVNVETLRLAMAYQETITRMGRGLADFRSRLEGVVERGGRVKGSVLELVALLPEAVERAIKAVEGVRFVSRSPETGMMELCIEAAEEGAAADFFGALRDGPPDLAGLVPGGLAIQWNTDPFLLAGVVDKGLAFFADETGDDSADLDACRRDLLASLADDAGRYLFGVTWEEGLGFVFASAVNGDDEGDVTTSVLLRFLLPGGSLSRLPAAGGSKLQRWRFGEGGENLSLFPPVTMLSGQASNRRITTLDLGDRPRPEDRTAKVLRLAAAGGGRLRTDLLPDEAALFFNLSLLPLPAVASFDPSRIMGFGVVEEKRLRISFLR